MFLVGSHEEVLGWAKIEMAVEEKDGGYLAWSVFGLKMSVVMVVVAVAMPAV